MKFRKKPVEIEAIQYTGNNADEIIQWCKGAAYLETLEGGREVLHIQTLESDVEARTKHVASVGDWIIQGVQGEFYPCKPDIFLKTYDQV